MTYFHVYVEYTAKGNSCYHVWGNISEQKVMERIVKPFNKNKTILFSTIPLKKQDIARMVFFISEKKILEVPFPNGKCFSDLAASEAIRLIGKQKIKGMNITTRFKLNFDNQIAQENESKAKPQTKIFIVHGREKTPALELKDYLKDTYGLDVVIFDDIKKKRTSPTIIEVLEDIASNAGYAFIVATPDDLGGYCKDIEKCKDDLLMSQEKNKVKIIQAILSKFKPRARQNVLFEHGLFLGALGRDRVCCLLQANTEDTQTDIDGVLYVSFKDSINETFPEIVEKLKDPQIGLIKP
jgi:predicted nucleotide-binding protein